MNTINKQQDVERLFGLVSSADPSEQDKILAADESDEAVKNEVRSLLAGHRFAEANALMKTTATHGGRGEGSNRELAGQLPTSDIADSLSMQSHFRLGEISDYGGMGIVFDATDLSANRRVAIKTLNNESKKSESNRHQFSKEANLTGRLQHPGIVPVHGNGKDDGGNEFYVMKFVTGETLLELVDRLFRDHGADKTGNIFASAGFRGLLTRFVSICRAIDYAHSQNILHLDLKLENFVIGDFGEAYVLDWGSAVETGSNCLVDQDGPLFRQPAGSPPYMAPERFQENTNLLSPKTDVYSLGVCLYAMLTNKLPFQGIDAIDIALKSAKGSFDKPTEAQAKAPKSLEAICLKAMNPQMSQRYASAGELADDIEQFMADEPTTASSDSIYVRMRRALRKHPRMAASLMTFFPTFLIASLLITGLVLWSNAKIDAQNTVLAAQNQEIKEQNQEIKTQNEEIKERNEEIKEQNEEIKEQNEELTRKEAEIRRERDTAQETVYFVRDDIFRQAVPAPGSKYSDITVRAAIDKVAPNIAKRFHDKPLVESAVSHVIGEIYKQLGDYKNGEKYLSRALYLRKQVHGPTDPLTLRLEIYLGILYTEWGRPKSGEKHLLKGTGADEMEDEYRYLGKLALAANYYKQRRYKDSNDVLVDVLDYYSVNQGFEGQRWFTARNILASLLIAEKKFREAEDILKEDLEVLESRFGEYDRRVVTNLEVLAKLHFFQGEHQVAEQMVVQVIERLEATLPPTHQRIIAQKVNLFQLYVNTKQIETAIAWRKANRAIVLKMNRKSNAYLAWMQTSKRLDVAIDKIESEDE